MGTRRNFGSFENYFIWKGGVCNSGRGVTVVTWLPIGLLLCRQKQQPMMPSFVGAGSFCLPWLLKTASQLLPEQVHSICPRADRWGMGSCYYARKWNWLKLATFSVHAFLWKLGAFNRLQFHSYRRQTLPMSLWYRGGGWQVPRLPTSTSLFYILIF